MIAINLPSVYGRYRQTLLLAMAAVLGGGLAASLRIPVAWMIGPLVGALLIALAGGVQRQVARLPQQIGQVIIGVSVGVSFPWRTFQLVGANLPALAVVISITLVLAGINGYILWRWAAVERGAALLGSVPGAASSMVAMGTAMGADARVVAVLQYIRLLTIVFAAPVIMKHLFVPVAPAAAVAVSIPPPLAHITALSWAGMVACALLGILVSKRISLPAGMFLGPFIVTLAASWSGLPVHKPPVWLFNIALLLIGATVGAQFDRKVLASLRRAVWLEPLLVLAFIGCSCLLGFVFHVVTGIDVVTATLGFVPGAMEAMIATSSEMGADVAMVSAMQVLRMLGVLLAGPVLVRWWNTRLRLHSLNQA